MTGPTKTYNTAGDVVVEEVVSTQRDPAQAAIQAVLDVKEEKRRAKEERKAKRRAEKEKAQEVEESGPGEDAMNVDDDTDERDRKDKKRKRRESEALAAVEVSAFQVDRVTQLTRI